jgi:hypothetical protein
MVRHLVKSFEKHKGERGCHFYDDEICHFLNWREVFEFIGTFPTGASDGSFCDRLTEAMANYDPDEEFLAVQQNGPKVSVELYAKNPGVKHLKE